jgi:hypothetical protein
MGRRTGFDTVVRPGELALGRMHDQRRKPALGKLDHEVAATVEPSKHPFEDLPRLRRTLTDCDRRRHGGGADAAAEYRVPQPAESWGTDGSVFGRRPWSKPLKRRSEL